MLLRLLKNDLLHGKLTNFMVMIFLAVSTMLSCASISLIYSSQNQISYFMDDMGKVADYNFSMMNITKKDVQKITAFMKAKDIDAYQIEHAITLPLSVMAPTTWKAPAALRQPCQRPIIFYSMKTTKPRTSNRVRSASRYL